MWSTRYSCPNLMKLEFSRQFFPKNTQIPHFTKICAVGAELLQRDGRTDGQTDMTGLTVAFRNFENTAKNPVCVSPYHCVTSKTRNTQTQKWFLYRYNYMNYFWILTPFLPSGQNSDICFQSFRRDFLSPFSGHPKERYKIIFQTLSIIVAYHTIRCYFLEFSDYCFTIPRTSNLTSGNVILPRCVVCRELCGNKYRSVTNIVKHVN
jgi:hypothetical protein